VNGETENDGEGSLFKSLIFVLRNYNQDDKFGEDDRIFDDLVSKILLSDAPNPPFTIESCFPSKRIG